MVQHKLAAHVQAAISFGLQAKKATSPLLARPALAPHVQAVIQAAMGHRGGLPRTPPPCAIQRAAIQRMNWSFGASGNEMNNQEWLKSGMNTFGSILYEDDGGDLQLLGKTKNLKTVAYGREHAEDVAMREILGQLEDLKGSLIVLNLSKSPCSSRFGTSGDKDPGCAENLVNFVKDTGIQLVVTCRGLYKGLKESADAVEWMRGKGINISVDVRVGRERRFGED